MNWLRSTAEEIARRSVVTDEPFAVSPDLLGHPLASIRRRGVAFALDSVAALALGIVVVVVVAVLAIRVQAPTAYRALTQLVSGESLQGPIWEQGQLEIYQLIDRRRPDLLPPSVASAVRAGDGPGLAEVLDREGIGINHAAGARGPSYFDPEANVLQIHSDVTLGRFGSVFNFLAVYIAYFSAFAALGDGRTPGKWMLRLRARRLDGNRMGWGSAFGRAGGYTSSAATLGLGFLAAVRDPNRQALHDRIAGTVVVIEGDSRIARLRDWLWRLGGTGGSPRDGG
jgi:uncharacterized RDD family membrane protein YckC